MTEAELNAIQARCDAATPKRKRGTVPTLDDLLRNTTPHGECRNWAGGIGSRGRGRIRVHGKSVMVTHLVMTLIGRPPGDLVVRHTCDNPRCIRPEHLLLGTQRDNVHDMLARNRRGDFHGENNGQSVFTAADVNDIRVAYRMGARSKDLIELYNTRPGTIYEILSLRRWVSR